MDNRPVGIFDTGLGGLTAVKAFRELMPKENIVYFGDSGRVPYGGRPRKMIRKMARQDLELVLSYDVKAVIVACGTITVAAPDVLDACELPLTGVLKAGVCAMSCVAGSAPLGVIATEASIRSGAFKNALSAACPGREIIDIACPEFVPLIESWHISADDPLLTDAVERALRPMKQSGIAALLLGCTHYGIIGDAISAYLGGDVQLISASECAAKEMRDRILSSGIAGGNGETRFITSGHTDSFDAEASAILGGWDVRSEYTAPMEVDEQ